MRRSRLGAFGALCAVALVVGGDRGRARGDASVGDRLAGARRRVAERDRVRRLRRRAGHASRARPGRPARLRTSCSTLDLSGSTGVPPSKLADLKARRRTRSTALDAADGATDQSIAGNAPASSSTGLGGHARRRARLELRHASVSDINGLPAPHGGSPHDLGINTASSALATGAGGSPRRWC